MAAFTCCFFGFRFPCRWRRPDTVVRSYFSHLRRFHDVNSGDRLFGENKLRCTVGFCNGIFTNNDSFRKHLQKYHQPEWVALVQGEAEEWLDETELEGENWTEYCDPNEVDDEEMAADVQDDDVLPIGAQRDALEQMRSLLQMEALSDQLESVNVIHVLLRYRLHLTRQ